MGTSAGPLWAHLRLKRERFDISGGWVNEAATQESYLKLLRRLHVNAGQIERAPGYTDNAALYDRYPLKLFNRLWPLEQWDADEWLPKIHAVEFLGEPQFGGGRPVPPQEVFEKLLPYRVSRLRTSVTLSEERTWRWYAGLSDFPHYDAYRVVAPAAEAPWFTRHLVGLEVGPTGAQFGHSDTNDIRYAARFDGREIVRRCVAAHSEYLVLWVRDGDYAYYAYYDSKLLPKAPGLGARDPLREAVEEARKHKLPVIAYCVVQQGGHFLKAHPEFEMRGADGRPIGRFCFNSEYLEAMKRLVAEQLDYGIDGFHIDMLGQGFGPPYGCWCTTCQDEFRKQFGRAMPKGATWDEDWNRMLEFRYATSDRFEKALTAHIKSLRPNATVDFNYHGNPPFSFELGQRQVQHADNGDFVTGETGVWGFSALTVG